ncbi:MAG TPA: hypothetical protein VMD08_05030, partial [Candidatus Baltobacteraceae bacterium]|nr:hypothetical protein [Candidatus Baltobacteraceae bacterium]
KIIRLWDVATRKECATLPGHRGWITSVAFGKDGKTLVSTDWEGTIQVWDLVTRTAHSLP